MAMETRFVIRYLRLVGSGGGVAREMTQHVLIVEDEEKIAHLVAKNLEAIGLTATHVEDGFKALEFVGKNRCDLVILDLMLPGIDGIEVCRRIRAQGSHLPILMLTARRTESDVVLGLEVGADDYLIKPFGTRELTARVRALLRRAEPEDQRVVTLDELSIDPARRLATIGETVVSLTTLEFDLLYFLAARPGRVYSRQQLLEQVWGEDRVVDPRSIDSLVSRLRKKIEADPNNPVHLQTVWGAGYRMASSR